MELVILGLGAAGCGVLLAAALVGLALQALFLNLGAKMAGVQERYSKAFWAVLAVGIVNLIVHFVWNLKKSPDEMLLTLENFGSQLAMNLLITLIVGTLVVTWVYSISVLRAALTYVSSLLLGSIFLVLLILGLWGLTWAFGGAEAVDQAIESAEVGYYNALREEAMKRGIDPSTVAPDSVSLLEDVEFTELESAVDVNVSDARRYIGRKVRVIHGTRSESIGTLKSVTATSLVVAVKIEGGRLDLPIQKSKITTFQLIDG